MQTSKASSAPPQTEQAGTEASAQPACTEPHSHDMLYCNPADGEFEIVRQAKPADS